MKKKLLSRKFLLTAFIEVAILVAAILKGVDWNIAIKTMAVAAAPYMLGQAYVDGKSNP